MCTSLNPIQLRNRVLDGKLNFNVNLNKIKMFNQLIILKKIKSS